MTLELDKVSYQKFQNILKKLDEVEQTPVVRNALQKGIQVIIQQGKSNLEQRNGVKTGNLKRSFTKSIKAKKGAAYAGFKRSAPGKRIQGANHSYLVDRGTTKRYTKAGAYRGAAKGTMFWTDAVQSQGPAAMNRLMDAIYDSLDKITRQR
jgi:hypothetical protein